MEAEILVLLNKIQSSLESDGKEWMPLLNTMAGGLMALLGAFGVQAIQLYSAKKKEDRKILREKMEEIGNLSNEFEDVIQKDFAMIIGVAAPDDKNAIPPVHRKLQTILLNINLYHSELSNGVAALEKACLSYFETKRKLVEEKNKKGKYENATLERAGKDFQKCIEAKKSLLSEVIIASNRFKINS